ncbi:MAG TPA: CaiB/BaiF CoA-transferase family protein [Chloroflexota bacterium]|nr:CaiB/BaiF CoA-transferase family protein [Chloroflexota bacterium]
MTNDARPLGGITVVDLSVNLPGPVASARLRDLGARVIKVEPPAGDPLSRVAPDWYTALCADKRRECLDLKNERGRTRLDQLLGGTDVLVTASRPRGLERLGLGWDAVHTRFPRLCQVAIVGFRDPYTDLPGHDLTYQAIAGLLESGGTGDLPRTLIADLGGAERAVSAALGLLLARERTGKAGYVEVALVDAAQAFAAPLQHGLTAPGGMLGGGYPPYNRYASADGWIVIAALEPRFWNGFVQAVGHVDLADPLATGVTAALAALFRTRTTAAWLQLAGEHDLPIADAADRT